MEEKEIIEGTKAICLFIGGEIKEAWRVQDTAHYTWHGDKVNEWRRIGGMPILEGKYAMCILLDHCKWHSDWNWLIPVVKKISDLVIKDSDNFNETKARWRPIANELLNCNLENVWFCVVKFIQWHNTQSK